MPASPPITLCIVNHDGGHHLAASLPTVVDSHAEGEFDEIVLLDNASADDSIAVFQRACPEGRVVRLPENRSPGTARNAGLKAATHDRILFMDNDVRLTPGCVRELARALERTSDAVAAAPRVVYADAPEVIQYDGADCHFLGIMIPRHPDRPVSSCGKETSFANSIVSACFLLDRGRWRGGEFFDPTFRFYGEDHDFGIRARLSGHRLLAVPTALVVHGQGTPDLSLRPGGSYSSLRVTTLICARWQVILKNYAARTALGLAPCLVLYEGFQLAGAIHKGWLREWSRALLWTARHLPELLRKRRAVQARRVIRDRDILQGGPLPFRPELTRSPLERAALRLLNGILGRWWAMARRVL
jgi:GT2 family glycosyltransferase